MTELCSLFQCQRFNSGQSKKNPARHTRAFSKIHSLIVFAIRLLNGSNSTASVISYFPCHRAKVRDNVVGDLFSLSLLHRDLCAREVTSERLVKTKIFSGLKLAF